MSVLLSADNKGTPLYVIKKDQLESWILQQPQRLQNWLAQNEYKDGVILVPDANGELETVVMTVAEPETFFACGDLIKKLPAGQYVLETEEQYKEAVAFGWAVGAYQFDRYKQKPQSQAVLAVGDQSLVEKSLYAVEGTNLVRDLVNTPAADMMPQHLSQVTQELAEKFGGQFSEIVGDDLLTQNYPTIHAVGRASDHKPRLLDLTWGDENAPKVT